MSIKEIWGLKNIGALNVIVDGSLIKSWGDGRCRVWVLWVLDITLAWLSGSDARGCQRRWKVHTTPCTAGGSAQHKVPAHCWLRKSIFVIQRNGMQASYSSNNHDNNSLYLLRASPCSKPFP